MHPILRNILAIVVGAPAGGLLNMGLILVSGSVVPPPEGADLTTMEGLQASMHLMQPVHFLFPFLAHALGTLLGAWIAALIAALIAAIHKMTFAMVVGVLFLTGGIMNVVMLPSPAWFAALDLVAAYLPMAYLGGKLATR